MTVDGLPGTSVRLAPSILCVDCEVIFEESSGSCPKCGGASGLYLAPILAPKPRPIGEPKPRKD